MAHDDIVNILRTLPLEERLRLRDHFNALAEQEADFAWEQLSVDEWIAELEIRASSLRGESIWAEIEAALHKTDGGG